MGTYHWDRHIGCFRGIYNVRRQVLFCGVCNHLRGRPKRTKIKNENWDVTGTFENHLRLRKVHQHVGILLGQFMLPPGLLKAGFAQCATRDVQRATYDECPFHKEQLRWAHIIEKVRGFANIPLTNMRFDIAWHRMTLHGAWWRMALWYTVRGLEARRGWQRKRRLNLRQVATRECRGQGHSGGTMMDHVTWMPWPSISDMPKIAPLWCFWSVPYIF